MVMYGFALNQMSQEKVLSFIDEIKGGVVPQEYRKPVEQGVLETLNGGVIAGVPSC